MDALLLGRLMTPVPQVSAHNLPGSGKSPDADTHSPDAAADSDHIELSRAANSPGQILNAEILSALEAALARDGVTFDRSVAPETFSPEKVAEQVLGFIDSVVSQYAADDPKRMELLQQARDGIERGFEEAEEILKGLGVLQGEVAGNIDRTWYLIQDGLDSLEDNSVMAAAPAVDEESGAVNADAAAATVVQAAGVTSRQSTSLVIDTLDGDRVTIEIDKQASAERIAFASQSGNTVIRGIESTREAQAEFSFHVDGELDDDEREAIESLIARVDKVADKFFNGNVQAAFNKAARLQFDSEELAGFTLDMNRSQHFEAVAAYRRAMPAGEHTPGVGDVASFGAELKSLFSDAGKHVFATPEKSLAGVFNYLVEERAGMNFGQVQEAALATLRDLVDRLVGLQEQDRMQESAAVAAVEVDEDQAQD